MSWSAASTQAQPVEVNANLAIDAVTIYPGSASVTRSGELDIPAGASTLVLEDLPGGLNPALLQLVIADTGVQFSNLRIQENYREASVSNRESELRDQLQALQDERQVIADQVETARSELRLLDNLLAGDSGVRPSIDGEELATLISVMSDNSAQARERIRTANIELRPLDREIEQVRFQLDQVANNQRSSSRVRINLQSDDAISTDVTLTYPQQGVSWSWIYEARLDTPSRRLSLFRQAAISQGTGEDWQDIILTLSTATPVSDPVTPELRPLFVDTGRRPVAQQRADGIEEVMVTGSRVRGDSESAGTAFSPVVTVDTRYQVDHVIPGRVSVAADRQQRIFPVDRDETEVELVSRAVPSRVARAYLEARFEYNGETPVQNARMQLYRDGARIGSTAVQPMLPGQSVRIPFGVDQRIEVARFDEQQGSGSTGVFNRADVREQRTRYEITSRHPEPVQVEVLDQIPVSRNDEITVEIPRQATTADETDVGGEAGLLLWRRDLEPQETAVIRHYYDIRYPQGSDIFMSP
ncbi:MAG: mucoidy inhibitor MuiA family protein [Pseudomonadota bacterium]